jgi:hypothetical protein
LDTNDTSIGGEANNIGITTLPTDILTILKLANFADLITIFNRRFVI